MIYVYRRNETQLKISKLRNEVHDIDLVISHEEFRDRMIYIYIIVSGAVLAGASARTSPECIDASGRGPHAEVANVIRH